MGIVVHLHIKSLLVRFVEFAGQVKFQSWDVFRIDLFLFWALCSLNMVSAFTKNNVCCQFISHA